VGFLRRVEFWSLNNPIVPKEKVEMALAVRQTFFWSMLEDSLI